MTVLKLFSDGKAVGTGCEVLLLKGATMRILSSAMIVAAMVFAGTSALVAQRGAAPVTVEQHAATMKMIQQNMGATFKAVKSGDAASGVPSAEALVAAFTTIETFYTQRNKPDAVKVAQGAKTGAQDVVAALKAGDTMKAQAGLGALQGACKQCHSTMREGDGKDTPYKFSAASGITPP